MTVNAYDIRTKDKFYQKRLDTICGVKIIDKDEEFYLNNCYRSYSATCNTSGTSRVWQKQTKRKKESEESYQRKRMKMVRQAENEQLARKTCYDKAVQNTDNEMFCNFDFNLLSGTRAIEITKTHVRSFAATHSMEAVAQLGILQGGPKVF